MSLPLKFSGLGVPVRNDVALSTTVISLMQLDDLGEMFTNDSFSFEV